MYDLCMMKKILDITLTRAEMIGEDGSLNRPTEVSRIPVPGVVKLDGDRLVWRGVSPGLERTVYSGKEMLGRFIQLARPNTTDEQIRDYASKWGVLHICEHGLPASHIPDSYSFSPLETVEQCSPLGWPAIPEDIELPEKEEDMEPLFSGWERIESWRYYAHEAQAILNIAAKLYAKEKVKPEDWKELTDEAAELLAREDVNNQLRYLIMLVKSWLALGNVRPDIICIPIGHKDKSQIEPKITLGGYGPSWGHLFGALACQLMYAVTRAQGLAFCGGCGNTYIPQRRVRTDRRHFCDGCIRRGESKRLAAVAYRQRKKDS
jgi:hypothetical protein